MITSDRPLPRRPRFVNDVVLVPDETGIIVDGTAHLWALRGNAAKTIVRHLIPLIDGTRDIDELKRALPTESAESIDRVLSTLFEQGLLEDESRLDGHAEQRDDPTLSFLRRFGAETRLNRGRQAYDLLRRSEVFIACENPGYEALFCQVLSACGIGTVSAWSATTRVESSRNRPSSQPSSRLVMSWGLGDRKQQQRELKIDAWASEANVPWLRAALIKPRGDVQVGPLFSHDNRAPCYDCFLAMHGGGPHDGTDRAEAMRADEALWIGMAACEAVCLLSGVGNPISGNVIRQYDLTRGERREVGWCRIPGCVRCFPLESVSAAQAVATSEITLQIGTFFEEAHAFRPETDSLNLGRPRPLGAFEPARSSRRLAGCKSVILPSESPRLSLPALSALSGTRATSRSEHVTTDQLATLLRMTAGLRRPQAAGAMPSRWAPTAGNLGSVELYAVVRDVNATAPGVYYYDAQGHVLVSLASRKGELPPVELMSRALRSTSELPDLVIVCTGALQRVARKYGAFAYRLIHLDAGVAVAQLQLVAQALGLYLRHSIAWLDDRLEERLRLEAANERPTAVISVSARPFPRARRDVEKRAGHKGRPIAALANMTAGDVIDLLISDSRPIEPNAAQMGLEYCNCVLPALSGMALDGQDHHEKTNSPALGEVLTTRRSTRTFSSQSIRPDTIREILRHALGHTPSAPDDSGAPPLTCQIFTVDDQAKTIRAWRYDAQYADLASDPGCPSFESVRRMYVQSECALAPVHLWLFGDITAACTADGTQGYRSLLCRAGVAIHRISLAAVGMGLTGSIVAGIVPRVARSILRPAGHREAALVAFIGGYSSNG